MFTKLSIIIPVYNEQNTISSLLKKVSDVVLPFNMTKEVVLIDDFSKDNSVQVINEYINLHTFDFFRLICHNKNMGKGSCIHSALKIVNGDLVIFQDADLECNPDDYKYLIHEMKLSNSNVVYGNRFENFKGVKRFNFHFLVNYFLTSLSNLKTGLKINDMECCYKLIQVNLIRRINLYEKRFGIEPEITAKLSKLDDVKFSEVPISYNRRSYKAGKKIGWKDGFRTIYCIFKY